MCPPSYHGDFCQYQSQRVSLTVKIDTDGNLRMPFDVVVLLIDNNGTIESHDTVLYEPLVDCLWFRFNIYLLYRSRPKDLHKNYSIQLHAYNKYTLEYHGSWLFPLIFPFLSAHRMVVYITIPLDRPTTCLFWCGNHGQCFKFINNDDNNAFYCQCDPGWSGIQSTVEHGTCHLCASGSLCIQ